jgi:cyanobactin biosynthesis protein (PatB/AcyB/McaB family)
MADLVLNRSPRPIQSPPVRRPELVEPSSGLDLDTSHILASVRSRLEIMHGANFNDPSPFQPMNFSDRMVRQ